MDFLYQILLEYEPKWIRLEQGSTFTAVSSSDIRSIEINLPCLKEQTKIANYLTALDKKIEIETSISEILMLQKQYLLQNLFI